MFEDMHNADGGHKAQEVGQEASVEVRATSLVLTTQTQQTVISSAPTDR